MSEFWHGLRWQVKYKEVMKQYGLGPNGGILTSCNLFATKFDKVGLQVLNGQLGHRPRPVVYELMPITGVFSTQFSFTPVPFLPPIY